MGLRDELKSVPTQQLIGVAQYLNAECDACDTGIAPDQKPVFRALLRRLDKELVRRALASKY